MSSFYHPLYFSSSLQADPIEESSPKKQKTEDANGEAVEKVEETAPVEEKVAEAIEKVEETAVVAEAEKVEAAPVAEETTTAEKVAPVEPEAEKVEAVEN